MRTAIAIQQQWLGWYQAEFDNNEGKKLIAQFD